MDIKRNQISPQPDDNRIVHPGNFPGITALIMKNMNVHGKVRRHSLDNMLGNAVAKEERTKEEIVREKLRQVIIKHHDLTMYITNDPDYIDFISNWSCHWWCSRLCCADRMERHFLESLDGDMKCALHYAILHNNLQVCEALIRDKKCDINIRGINQKTVWHMYASRKKWEKSNEEDPGEQILNLLASTSSKLEIDPLDDELQTPLHHAVKYNDCTYANWLIDHGADVTKASRFYETPLHLACSLFSDEDCIRMIEILLPAANKTVNNPKYLLDVNFVDHVQRRYLNMYDGNEKTALCRAAEKNHVETVRYLLKYSDEYQRETALVSAVKSGNCTILNMILDTYKNQYTSKLPILHLACKLNQGRRIADRSSITNSSVSSSDEDCITPFLVERLQLNREANFNKEGYTPILLATHFGSLGCVKYLIETSRNIEHQLLECTQSRQQNIFHICAEQAPEDRSDESCVQFIYDSDKKQVEVSHPKTKTKAARNLAYLDICKFVLEIPKHKDAANKLLYEQDNNGNTPLHIACCKRKMTICELFVKYMKDDDYLFATNMQQLTPLHICSKFGNRDLVKLLLPNTTNQAIVKRALNETYDMDGKTPLHLACAEGNLDVVSSLVEDFDACLITAAHNRDTPFTSACRYGHLDVVNYLLEKPQIDATFRNSKGLNALDVAIVNRQESITRRLLACDNWRRLMQNAYYEDNNVVCTPMRELIIYMPDIAYEIIDTKLTSVKGDDSMAEYKVTYDYTFFEDQYHIRDWMYGDKQKVKNSLTNDSSHLSYSDGKNSVNPFRDVYTSSAYVLVRNHPLLILARCEQIKLMQHDYCVRLAMNKFQRFGLIVFTLFFLIYTLFVLIFTVAAILSKHPYFFYDLYNQSVNGTFTWDLDNDAKYCEIVGTFLKQANNTNFLKGGPEGWITPFLYSLLAVFITKNVIMIIFSFPRIFRTMSLYLEIISLVLCFVFILDWYSWQVPIRLRCPIQWQLGAMGLLLSWIGIISYIRYIPWMNCGLYVVMMQVIFSKFLKCLPLLLILICGFGFTYYMLLQYQAVYASAIESLLRTAISLYDLGYEAHLYSPSSGGVVLYPLIYVVMILAEVTLIIIITNLLIGLAVGEIPTLKTQALLNRNIIFYELFFDYEYLHMQLKGMVRCLIKRIRRSVFPCCCCLCESCATCTCCQCAVDTDDYINTNRERQESGTFSRWLDKIDGWLFGEEVQLAITLQKERKKTNALNGTGSEY